jgi:hypothetical protein
VPFGVGVLLLVIVAGLLEAALAARGFRPTVGDSPAVWGRERTRASEVGAEGLILVGASRSQLDIDLGVLGRVTGKHPVQLAIDGSSFLPVLADLARDDRVTGTVIVEFGGSVPDPAYQDAATHYVDVWRRGQRLGARYDFAWMEGSLADWRQGILRSYADNGGPLEALSKRVLPHTVTPQYLVTLPSGSREADYLKVDMPAFYFRRAMRNAGIDDVPDLPDDAAVNRYLSDRIRALPQASAAHLLKNATLLGQMVKRIEARGGQVIFVMYPNSGLVRETDDVRYPRAVFWDRVVPLAGGKGLYFSDEASLRDFTCPDGSHLDMRAKRRFTEAFAKALESRGWIRVGS